MKNMKKKTAALLIAAALLGSTSAAQAAMQEQPALDAFYELMSETDSAPDAANGSRSSAYDTLEAVMSGTYSQLPEEESELDSFSESLPRLSAITTADIAAYASVRNIEPGAVRHAWYQALANVLSAEMALSREDNEKYQGVAEILSLFIGTSETPAGADTETESQKEEVRRTMTPERSAEIADALQLPEAFVEYVIMSPSIDDDQWEDDEDWRSGTAFESGTEEGFTDITIGMKDSPSDTRIAELQEVLIKLGYLSGKADGVFGGRTQAALLEFQYANAMKANGIYSGSVYRKLSDEDLVARWDYDDEFWDPDDDDRDYDTPDYDTPDDDDRDDADRNYDTPDYNTPDYNTPDYNTPDDDTDD